MISEHEIARNCFGRTLQRARQIAASPKNILTKQCRYSERETTLTGFVASSSGWADSYRVSVALDEDADRIREYRCTCPAYLEYDGMCKHCAALVLAYNASPGSFFGYEEERTPSTSQTLAEFMERTGRANRGARSGQEVSAGTVDIEVTLTYGYREWSAQFRVAGPQSSYVIKDLGEFAELLEQGAWFSYGKKLAFTHTRAAFTSRGRALEGFIEHAVAVRRHAGSHSFGYWRAQSGAPGRSLTLSEAEVVDLLDALEGGTFVVRGEDYGTRAYTEAHVVREDPAITLGLAAAGAYGYALTRPDAIVVMESADRVYVWKGEVFYRCSPAFARCADFLRSVYESPDDRLYLAAADLPRFCATVLALTEGVMQVHIDPEIAAEVEACRPVPCELEFYFDRTPAYVLCEPKAVYGTKRVSLGGQAAHDSFGEAAGATKGRRAGGTVRPRSRLPHAASGGASSPRTATRGAALARGQSAPMRDEAAENAALELVGRFFPLHAAPEEGAPALPAIKSDDGDAIAALLFGGLAAFAEMGAVFTTPAFDRLLRDSRPRIQTGLSLEGNLINLTVSSDDLPPEELAALLASYRRRKTYHRLADGTFVDLAGYELSQLEQAADDLGISVEKLASGAVELPVYQAFYLDEELAEARRDDAFMRYIESFDANATAPHPVPAALARVLRPYQKAGFEWLSLLADHGFGGILADEMGLGKSVQLITFLLDRQSEARQTGPSLIVCPASLVYNWLAEFERFAPGLEARAVTGSKQERMRIRARAFSADDPADVLITSYDLLRLDIEDYVGRALFCCTLDEAQYIKNHTTKVAKAVKRIDARVRFALTGTPMENRPSEIWSIFDFLMPGLLGSYPHFRERFELDVLGGDEGVTSRLHALVGPFMLRRLKADVLADLPDKLETVVYAQMKGEQLKLYRAHEQRIRETLTAQKDRDFQGRKIEVLAELTRLRQLCCDPRLLYENYAGHAAKMDAIVELVESAVDAGEKTLVFSQFTSFLSLIAAQFDRRGIAYYTITGATPKKRRLELVNAFNADATPVFLISLKAGGTGLNLTGASVVVHADPWWNAAAQNQATDRAHRIGQTRVVSVCKVIAKDTIEERILRLQEEKAQLAEQIIGGDAVSLATLTADDLIDLLTAR